MNDTLYFIWSDKDNLNTLCETSVLVVYTETIDNAPMIYVSQIDLEVYSN